jgi:hypothetical protein
MSSPLGLYFSNDYYSASSFDSIPDPLPLTKDGVEFVRPSSPKRSNDDEEFLPHPQPSTTNTNIFDESNKVLQTSGHTNIKIRTKVVEHDRTNEQQVTRKRKLEADENTTDKKRSRVPFANLSAIQPSKTITNHGFEKKQYITNKVNRITCGNGGRVELDNPTQEYLVVFLSCIAIDMKKKKP